MATFCLGNYIRSEHLKEAAGSQVAEDEASEKIQGAALSPLQNFAKVYVFT